MAVMARKEQKNSKLGFNKEEFESLLKEGMDFWWLEDQYWSAFSGSDVWDFVVDWDDFPLYDSDPDGYYDDHLYDYPDYYPPDDYTDPDDYPDPDEYPRCDPTRQ